MRVGSAVDASRDNRGFAVAAARQKRELDDVEGRHPAQRYVMVDDKMRTLTAVKRQWADRVTTVFARQGHYAHVAPWPPPTSRSDASGTCSATTSTPC